MTMYQPNIPTGLVPLNEDYQNLQNNFTQINTTYNTDHVPLTEASQNGYHTVVHLAKQVAGTVGISNTFSLYEEQTNDGYATRQQLFAISGTGTPYALTRNFTPSLGTNGITFLPGGLVIQWGFVNGTHSANNHFNQGDVGTVTFSAVNTAFPNNCYGVWFSLQYSTAAGGVIPDGTASVQYDTNTLSKLKFDWSFSTGSSKFTNFMWVAIGN